MVRFNQVNFSYKTSTFSRRQSGDKSRKNQDAVKVVENKQKLVCFLIDGATELADITATSKLKLSGYWVASIAERGLSTFISKTTSARKLLLLINDLIAKKMKEKQIDPEVINSAYLPTASGAIMVYIDKKNNKIEVAQLGDAGCLVFKKNGIAEPAFSLKMTREDLEAIKLSRELCLKYGTTMKKAFHNQRIASLILKGRSKENLSNGKGYGAMNGKKSAKIYIKTRFYKTQDIKTLLLMSDGMIPPEKKFSKWPNWKLIEELFKKGGTEEIHNYVRKLNYSDKNLTRYPRFKLDDDASCCVIEIENLK